MFKYEEYYVHQRFSIFIKKLWILDNLNNPGQITGKAVLPNGCFNIAVIEGAGLMIKHLGWEKHLIPGTYFCGQMTEAISVDLLPQSKATMIQLHPWTPMHFTSLDLQSFTDNVLPLALLDINSNLIDKMTGLSNEEIFQNIILTFTPAFKVGVASKRVYQASKAIMDSKGTFTITQLALKLECSSRYLQKIFKKHIGLSPKQLSSIVKLRAAVDDIAYPDQQKTTLTMLALGNNFYDQAHFNNAFKSIVKTSPHNFYLPDYFLSFKR
ncbi:AraC family transcriptional regulator [Pedobacter duraquae]|uniref:AraC-like DNA-binding protein n=1 Tax=Pedobacter duraquae TaxID=425511 RepID=A0A4R6IKS0_9SPHI|nr:AraC family transcriptional regulator [Pedobacter duraquae]TDO22657.1 AraC-like DNA-binding protein [Pedobacter duraquae]